jgi:Apoptosis antagonizing transcription factor
MNQVLQVSTCEAFSLKWTTHAGAHPVRSCLCQGLAVALQQRRYNGALELRILLQKALGASHRLPRPPALDATALAQHEQLHDSYQAFRQAAGNTLSMLLGLQAKLMEAHPAIAVAAEASGAGAVSSEELAVEDTGAGENQGTSGLVLKDST